MVCCSSRWFFVLYTIPNTDRAVYAIPIIATIVRTPQSATSEASHVDVFVFFIVGITRFAISTMRITSPIIPLTKLAMLESPRCFWAGCFLFIYFRVFKELFFLRIEMFIYLL